MNERFEYISVELVILEVDLFNIVVRFCEFLGIPKDGCDGFYIDVILRELSTPRDSVDEFDQ
jgi:hypothetical protein